MNKSIWKTGTPEQSGKYVVITKYDGVTTLPYSKKHDLWNAYDRQTRGQAKRTAIKKSYIKCFCLSIKLIELVESELAIQEEVEKEINKALEAVNSVAESASDEFRND